MLYHSACIRLCMLLQLVDLCTNALQHKDKKGTHQWLYQLRMCYSITDLQQVHCEKSWFAKPDHMSCNEAMGIYYY